MKFPCSVLSLTALFVMAHAVSFSDCGSSSCKIDSVDVSDCAADAQSCDFIRGKSVTLTLKFTTNKDISSLNDTLEGYVEGAWIPFRSVDACGSTTPGCPIKSGASSNYTLSVIISDWYPQISLTVKSEMTDGDGVDCTCFKIQAQIK